MLDLVKRYAAPVPRYTSYPTAPHFSREVQTETYARWLADLPTGANLSLYTHIPYCHELCWYCGCTTKALARYEPVPGYVDLVIDEICRVSSLVPRRHRVSSIHWGGGSPNILKAAEIERLNRAARAAFVFDHDATFSVEIDPRTLDPDQVTAFAQAGVNRVSVGVQDFSPAVQKAINRHQSIEKTRAAIEMFRAAGVGSINIDLVYGLPSQTRRSLVETMRAVLDLAPDRIAVFGYAHLPSRFRHQRLIDEATLPDMAERFAQSRRITRILAAAGYRQIGLDHYARPTDGLALQPLKRNFQGYTLDDPDALIGFGVSAIGKLPQGYAQNAPGMHDYKRLIEASGLATVRGVGLTADDRMRAMVIERLMCDFRFPAGTLKERFGQAAEPLLHEAEAIVEADTDGLVQPDIDGFLVTERGRPFVRSICACFDAYLDSHARHSPGV